MTNERSPQVLSGALGLLAGLAGLSCAPRQPAAPRSPEHVRLSVWPDPLDMEYCATADPIADVAHAIAGNDYRFVMVLGFAGELPGLDREAVRRSHWDYRIVRGTSDFYESANDRRLNELSWGYAEKFNGEMAARTRNTHLLKKESASTQAIAQ